MSNGNGRLAKRLLAGGVVGLTALAFAPTTAGAAISTTAFCANVPTGQSGFTDIAAAGVHSRNVECLKGSEITSGTTATTYSPTANVTRGQMATFIANMIDKANELDAPAAPAIPDLPASGADAFTDDETSVHENNINRIAAADIVQGTTATTFSPDSPVSRAQMATFIAEALEFIRGSALPEGTDAFADDETSVHEANINRLATADIVDGTSATTYNPSGLVSRAQMASFIIQALADLHADGFIVPVQAAGVSGQVVDCDNPDITFVVGNAPQTAISDATDTFLIDNEAASQAVFFTACDPGDTVEFVDDTSATDADIFRLTNVAFINNGMVGNVDIASDDFDAINSVTGTALREIDYSGGAITFSVNGSAASLATFEGALSEGDTFAVTRNASNVITSIALTDASLSGVVTDVSGATFQIRDAFGDDPADGGDTAFEADAADTFTVGGSAATLAQFTAALSNGDQVTYSRTAGVETYALTNQAPTPVAGTVSFKDDQDFVGNTIDIVTGVTSETTCAYTSGAQFRVDGVVVTEAQFEAAVSAGDDLSCQPADAPSGTAERVTLTNKPLTGKIDSIDTATDEYRVAFSATTNQSQFEIEEVVYTAQYFGKPDRYFVNNTEVTLAVFEQFLDDIDADITAASGALDADDVITVVNAALATEHRLATDNTI